jgi:hypothetical protein
MKEVDVTDRLTYLAEKFDVFECDLGEEYLTKKLQELNTIGYKTSLIKNGNAIVIAVLSLKKRDNREHPTKNVSVSSDVFTSIIAADPTDNKIYIQWMLNIFTSLIKGGEEDIKAAIRFVEEDLPQANAYLTLFENNKRKKKFIDLCKASYTLKNVKDPTNINQYVSLSQLFDGVDPFIEKEPSAVERVLNKFVSAGQAIIPVKDRKFTLYIPKTVAASVVFDKFTSWCTAREGNGMFNSYTSGNKKPNGKDSDIYIIINNKFFSGESDEMYQLHFETNQLRDRKNGHQNVSIFENVISESEGLSNFFHDELMVMAKGYKKGIENNKYLDFLIQFGFTESLFEMIDEDTPTIKFMNREIPKLPDISRFKSLDQLIICSGRMVELHPSIGKLTNLEMISLADNKIKTLPKEIGYLKKLLFINLIGNPIKDIPSEIAYLDKTNGGSLQRLGIKEDEIGAENYRRLKELLPTTNID